VTHESQFIWVFDIDILILKNIYQRDKKIE